MVAAVKPRVKPDRVPEGLFKALADASRRQLLRLLANEDLPLKRIEAQFRMSRPALIKHIRILKKCGLVRVRRNGRETIHSVNLVPLRSVSAWVAELEVRWDDALQKLKQQVESDL